MRACQYYGMFQIVNHKVETAAANALRAAYAFFNLPREKLAEYRRYCPGRDVHTSILRHGHQNDYKSCYWRDILALYDLYDENNQVNLKNWPIQIPTTLTNMERFLVSTRRLEGQLLGYIAQGLGEGLYRCESGISGNNFLATIQENKHNIDMNQTKAGREIHILVA